MMTAARTRHHGEFAGDFARPTAAIGDPAEASKANAGPNGEQNAEAQERHAVDLVRNVEKYRAHGEESSW